MMLKFARVFYISAQLPSIPSIYLCVKDWERLLFKIRDLLSNPHPFVLIVLRWSEIMLELRAAHSDCAAFQGAPLGARRPCVSAL